jgi:hypothetical protein
MSRGQESPCPDSANGIEEPVGVAVSLGGSTVSAVDTTEHEIASIAQAADGELSQPGGPGQCIQDAASPSGPECGSTAPEISHPRGAVVGPDGDNLYKTGSVFNSNNGTIAEFTHAIRRTGR